MSAYRQNPLANLSPVVKVLLVINFLCYLPCLLLSSRVYEENFVLTMGAAYFNSPIFRPWQPITYMFFHGNFWHILFNMFALFSFGTIVEYTLGSKRFLNFYFICGIGALVLQMLVQAYEVHALTGQYILHLKGNTIPQNLYEMQNMVGMPLGEDALNKLYGIYFGPMVGASGAIFGLLVAFGLMFPNAELMLFFIPIPVKAKYVIPGYIIIELFLGFEQFSGDPVAHFAHLGGAIIGFILIKLWRVQRPNNFF